MRLTKLVVLLRKNAEGYGGGTVWFDDISLKRMNGALTNVIRTDSSNIVVTDLTKTKTYLESIDYNVVNGEMKAPFDASHTPSRIERIANGSIASTETVLVSYDFVVPIVGTLGVANYVCLVSLEQIVFSLRP